MKHCLQCLIYLLNRNKISGVNEEVKSSKSMLRERSLTIGGGGVGGGGEGRYYFKG